MNPSRILPDLQCSLVCEEVRQEANGNFLLLGILGYVAVPQIPITAFKLCLFNRWTAGVGQFTESVRILAPDKATVIRTSSQKFALQEAAQHFTSITVLPQVQFPTAGVYYVEVLVDEVMKMRYPLPLVLVTPPAGAPGAPQKPAPSAPESASTPAGDLPAAGN
jgi:hypothetical protein